MAATASAVTGVVPAAAPPPKAAALMKSIVDGDGGPITTVPSNYVFHSAAEAASDPAEKLPTIDFSQLTSGEAAERSRAIEELGKACRDWGFFMVTNHGSEAALDAMLGACAAFFELPEEEKRGYAAENNLSPINAGTSFNRFADGETAQCWRDFLVLFLHPDLHSPDKPPHFREAAAEFRRAGRGVGLELLRAASASLGLSEDRLERASGQEEGFSLLTANLYPPCPQPELAMGIASHTDDSFFSLVVQNGVGGLQLLRDGRWYNVHAPPRSYLVIVSDHMEMMSNGRYKSAIHRGVVNSTSTRMSVALSIAPSMESMLAPLPELVDETHPPTYRPIKYEDYFKMAMGAVVKDSLLSEVRIPVKA